MPQFSATSLSRLGTCHADLRRLAKALIEDVDFVVLCGHRDRTEQMKAFESGKSKLTWPKSKHNLYPSRAIDIAPYPLSWADTDRFVALGGLMMAKAASMGIKLRWGGNWDQDGKPLERGENDLVHFELV